AGVNTSTRPSLLSVVTLASSEPSGLHATRVPLPVSEVDDAIIAQPPVTPHTTGCGFSPANANRAPDGSNAIDSIGNVWIARRSAAVPSPVASHVRTSEVEPLA